MAILSKPVGIAMAAVIGIAAGAALGQSTPVLTGAAAYGDWRSDAPGVRRKITVADMPPPYATASVNNGGRRRSFRSQVNIRYGSASERSGRSSVLMSLLDLAKSDW